MKLVIDVLEFNCKTATTLFVNILENMNHLMRCTKEVSAAQYPQLFVDNVFRLHGIAEGDDL